MDVELNSDWDIEPTGSNLTLVTGADAIKQHLGQRLKTFYGEWFLDMEKGIPYFQQVLKKNPDPVVIDSIFKREIIDTPGILQLLEFDLSIDNATRILALSFKVLSIDGEIDFSEVIP